MLTQSMCLVSSGRSGSIRIAQVVRDKRSCFEEKGSLIFTETSELSKPKEVTTPVPVAEKLVLN